VKASEIPDENDLLGNPYILSHTESVPKYSFVDSSQPFDETCPPPVYMPDKLLFAPLNTKKEDILRGLEELPIGGLICTD
jgi:hypothetical protein